MYAGFLNKLKPRLPLLCQMHRLCSVARVTYSEFGLTFGSKSPRATQPVWPSWKAAGIHPVAHFHTLPFATCIPITATRTTPRCRTFLCLGRGAPFPPGSPPLRSNDYL